VTGVQTCALPISRTRPHRAAPRTGSRAVGGRPAADGHARCGRAGRHRPGGDPDQRADHRLRHQGRDPDGGPVRAGQLPAGLPGRLHGDAVPAHTAPDRLRRSQPVDPATAMVVDGQQAFGMIGTVMWTMLRTGALLMAMPLIGTRAVPVRIRVLVAGALAMALSPMLPPVPGFAGIDAATVLGVARELALGVAM